MPVIYFNSHHPKLVNEVYNSLNALQSQKLICNTYMLYDLINSTLDIGRNRIPLVSKLGYYISSYQLRGRQQVYCPPRQELFHETKGDNKLAIVRMVSKQVLYYTEENFICRQIFLMVNTFKLSDFELKVLTRITPEACSAQRVLASAR